MTLSADFKTAGYTDVGFTFYDAGGNTIGVRQTANVVGGPNGWYFVNVDLPARTFKVIWDSPTAGTIFTEYLNGNSPPCPPATTIPGNLVIPAQRSQRSNVLDVELVRHAIWDRTAKDNPMELDLEFSDKEIQFAMEFMVMQYNEIQPYVETIQTTAIPKSMFLLHGILAKLFMAKRAQLSRDDVEYEAGNASVDINVRKIKFLETWFKFFNEDFESKAQNRKIAINVQGAFGSYGLGDHWDQTFW